MQGPNRNPERHTPSEYQVWQEPRTWSATTEGSLQRSRPLRSGSPTRSPRAIVRVVEIGFENHTLLDRDLYRLLNSLGNAAQIFFPDPNVDRGLMTKRRQACAGVMIRSLANAGLTAGSVIDKKPEWFYEPALQLGHLWSAFKEDADLSNGCAAGLVAVLYSLEAVSPEHCLEVSIKTVWRETGGLPPITSQQVLVIARSGLFESPHHLAWSTSKRSATPGPSG